MISQPTPGGRKFYQLTTRVLVNVTKRMEKAPTFLCQYFEFKKIAHYTQHPFKNAVGYFFNNVDGKRCTTVLSVFFCWYGSNPRTLLSLCRAIIFIFILVYTQVRRVIYSCIIIYTMKKHNFTWTYVFNCLIGLFSFLIETKYLSI